LDRRTGRGRKQGRDDGIKQLLSYAIMEVDICMVGMYSELIYAIIPPCIPTFAVLLSLHPVTLLLVRLTGGSVRCDLTP